MFSRIIWVCTQCGSTLLVYAENHNLPFAERTRKPLFVKTRCIECGYVAFALPLYKSRKLKCWRVATRLLEQRALELELQASARNAEPAAQNLPHTQPEKLWRWFNG